jgi:hypothetical protein
LELAQYSQKFAENDIEFRVLPEFFAADLFLTQPADFD